jgi:hypothetical protein
MASIMLQLVRYLWICPISHSQMMPATEVFVVSRRRTIVLMFRHSLYSHFSAFLDFHT